MTRIMFQPGASPVDDPRWALGRPVRAAGSDVVVAYVLGHGIAHDGRHYAEVEMTPAGLGVADEDEEDPFG